VLTPILVGVDGSERAMEAVRQAAVLAAALDGRLTVAYVIDSGRPHDDDVETAAERVLAAATEVGRSNGVAADARVLAGEPGEALVEHAEQDRAGLLCLGPDAGLLGGAIRVGRTAAHVLRHATCSVLVARRAGIGFPERLACAVDGSDASVETASVAARLAAATDGELQLIHVVPVFRGDNEEWTLDPDEPSPPELELPVKAAEELGVTPLRLMAMGRPEHAIVAAAKRDETDLMVVGHRGVSGLRRVFLGSVSEHVAHHASCSVLVARPAPAPGGADG
jgi:nucleotide-binding universal stress UspA family protein